MPSLAPIKVPIVGVDQYTKAFQKMLSSVDKVGKAITSTGKKLTASVTAPIVGVGVASLKMSKDFNQAMASVGSLIPGQSSKLQKLKQDVLALGAETGKSSNLIAEGLYETISAFGDADDPINKLRISTQMSIAGLSTVKEALSLVSAVTKGYGDTSDEAAQKVSDLSFLTVKLGQTTFPELASSIGKVVPLATTLGVSQEEMFAGFATLTGVTGGAAEVATQLASALGAFITPSKEMTKQAKALGFESSVAMVQELGLVESLEKLKEKTGGSEIAMGKLLTRKEGLNAALTILNKQSDTFADKLNAMSQAAGGATSDAYAEMTGGINRAGFAMDRFSERARIASIRIGDKLAPVLMRLMDSVEPLLDKIMNVSDETLMMGIKIAAAAAVIGPALIVIGQLVSAGAALAGVIGGASGISAALTLLSGPIGWAIAAVAGLTAAVIYFWDELKPVRDAIAGPFIATFEDFKSIFESSTDSTRGFTGALKKLVSGLSQVFAPVVKLATKLLLLPLRMIIKQVKASIVVWETIGEIFNLVFKTVELGVLWLSNLWTEFKEGTTVGKTLSKVFDAIGEAIDFALGKLKDLWSIVSDFLGLGSVFDGLNDGLDKAISKQAQIAEANDFGGLGYTSTNEEFNQSVMDSIELGYNETVINLTVENTPDGPKVSASSPKGKPAKIHGPQGPVAQGAM